MRKFDLRWLPKRANLFLLTNCINNFAARRKQQRICAHSIVSRGGYDDVALVAEPVSLPAELARFTKFDPLGLRGGNETRKI